MNKKMLIPIIAGGVAIVIIIIIILVLSLNQGKKEDEDSTIKVNNSENEVTTNETTENNELGNTLENGMANQAVSAYNSAITAYIGPNKTAVDAKSLIDTIIESNNSNADNPGNFIALDVTAINASLGKIGEPATSNNTVDYVTECSSKMDEAKQAIDMNKTYSITATYTTEGLVSTMKIEYAGEWAGGNSNTIPEDPTTGGENTTETAEKNAIKTSLQTAINSVISAYHQAQSLTGGEESARTLIAYIKNEIELQSGTLKQALPTNYILSNAIVSGNSISFTLTIDQKEYKVTFNGVSREITIE